MSQRPVTTLRFKAQHLSIDVFNPVEIPQFVVLTGENGSGKTHLLDAIANGKVVIDGISKPEIATFNYETFKLENESSFSAHQVTSEAESAWDYFIRNVLQQARQWSGLLPLEYRSMPTDSGAILLPLNESITGAYHEKIFEFMGHQNRVNDATAQSILSMALKLPFSLDKIDKETFIRLYQQVSLKANFLPMQLGRAFWSYYVRRQRNRLNRLIKRVSLSSLLWRKTSSIGCMDVLLGKSLMKSCGLLTHSDFK